MIYDPFSEGTPRWETIGRSRISTTYITRQKKSNTGPFNTRLNGEMGAAQNEFKHKIKIVKMCGFLKSIYKML